MLMAASTKKIITIEVVSSSVKNIYYKSYYLSRLKSFVHIRDDVIQTSVGC